MEKEIKEYWLYLDENTYLAKGKAEFLLYRIDKNKTLVIKDPNLFSLLSQLEAIENMGSIIIKSNITKSKALRKIISGGYGNIIPIESHTIKPIVLPHKCKLNIDFDKSEEKEETIQYQLQITNITRNLLKLVIYFDNLGDILTSKINYSRNHHQEKKKYISYKLLKLIIKQISFYPIQTIELNGKDILNHPYFKRTVYLIHQTNKEVRLTLEYKFFKNHNFDELKYIDRLIINVNPDFSYEELSAFIFTHDVNNIHWNFRLIEESDIKKFQKIVQKYNINYSFIPFYNENNEKFIKSLLSMTKDDILSRSISWREIFRNQKLNSNLFGVLYILPDGSVYSNLNAYPIGNILTEKLSRLIYKELITRNYWRKTRDKTSCSDCAFHFLCPPPSEYEITINNFKLCRL